MQSQTTVTPAGTAVRQRAGLRISQIVVPALAYLVAALMLFPLFWMITQSLTPEKDIYVWPLRLWPESPTFDNYRTLFFGRPDLPMARWYFNSFFVASITTALVLAVASLAAYGYARLQFPFRDQIFYALLATLMIPGAVTFIPVFILLRDLRWLDTYMALTVPHASSVFAVFLLRQFFQSIPRELEEAAVLDGCSRFGVYWRIVLPLSTSALAALAIFTFLGNWNDFLGPFVFTNELTMRTLPVGLTIFNGQYWSERGLIMAGATISSIPVLIVYAIFQQQIIRGIALTGLKG
ncbi:MAG: carbohydrate ABC transporter permease [Chloroflexi bacterium]|nr:carbohydrate ABC transporter permease [Chloroflexota bacterium]